MFLAPRDRHLLFEDGMFRLGRGPKQHFVRPAVDVLFESAAKAHGRRVVAVVLSGGGFDGAMGALAIKRAGGIVLAQDLEDADIPFMPMHTIQRDHVDAVLPLPKLIEAITALSAGKEIEANEKVSRPHRARELE
ncbi:Chemotaxis response regulator protein-glutamate methylesterase CheB [Minicystis rosea]|nr:Chemotaxis response regulator protein-glutamate methylesterase CheB [Minicystis rosea]